MTELDGSYIDYGDQGKLPKDWSLIFMDVFGILHRGIERHDPEHLYWEQVEDQIHERFKEIPHKHQSSMVGPYCTLCYCGLPGPNGQWE